MAGELFRDLALAARSAGASWAAIGRWVGVSARTAENYAKNDPARRVPMLKALRLLSAGSPAPVSARRAALRLLFDAVGVSGRIIAAELPACTASASSPADLADAVTAEALVLTQSVGMACGDLAHAIANVSDGGQAVTEAERRSILRSLDAVTALSERLRAMLTA